MVNNHCNNENHRVEFKLKLTLDLDLENTTNTVITGTNRIETRLWNQVIKNQ